MRKFFTIFFIVFLLLFSCGSFSMSKPIPTTDIATWDFTAEGFFSWLTEPDPGEALKKYGLNEALNKSQIQEIVDGGAFLQERGVLIPRFSSWELIKVKLNMDTFNDDVLSYTYTISIPQPIFPRNGTIAVTPLSEEQKTLAEEDFESSDVFKKILTENHNVVDILDQVGCFQTVYAGSYMANSNVEFFWALVKFEDHTIYFEFSGQYTKNRICTILEDITAIDLVNPEVQQSFNWLWVVSFVGVFSIACIVVAVILVLRKRREVYTPPSAAEGSVPPMESEPDCE